MAKSKKRPEKPVQSDPLKAAKEREQDVYTRRATLISKGCAQLVTSLSQDIAPLVNRVLASPRPEEQRMLDAWRCCGARDADTDRAVDVAHTATKVQTPFGYACLMAYAQAYEDAVQARLEQLKKATAS